MSMPKYSFVTSIFIFKKLKYHQKHDPLDTHNSMPTAVTRDTLAPPRVLACFYNASSLRFMAWAPPSYSPSLSLPFKVRKPPDSIRRQKKVRGKKPVLPRVGSLTERKREGWGLVSVAAQREDARPEAAVRMMRPAVPSSRRRRLPRVDVAARALAGVKPCALWVATKRTTPVARAERCCCPSRDERRAKVNVVWAAGGRKGGGAYVQIRSNAHETDWAKVACPFSRPRACTRKCLCLLHAAAVRRHMWMRKAAGAYGGPQCGEPTITQTFTGHTPRQRQRELSSYYSLTSASMEGMPFILNTRVF